MPGSNTFSKQLRVPRRPLDQLAAAIRAEAVNFIPQDVEAVKLDFHILGDRGDDEVDVLVVAVRDEVLESYRNAVESAGLSLEVVDVDLFALQNCFEFSDPAAAQQTVGLIDVGSSMSSINICRAGSSIFTGDISIGVGALIDAVRTGLNVSRQEAREIACAPALSGAQGERAREIIDARLDKLALECDRQLNFFWKAAGAEGAIDRIVFSGGGACVRGIAHRIGEKTGIAAEVLDPLRRIQVPPDVDDDELRGRGPLLGVAVGLALRAPGDRIVPECISKLTSRRTGRGGVA
jgi:type IV pilus assembly protein PilM